MKKLSLLVLSLIALNLAAVSCAKKRINQTPELQMIERDTDILSEEELEEFPESK